MLKKLFTAVMAAVCITTYACWFTTGNFNGNYIAGVNNYQAHYTETEWLADAVYHNGIQVSMPITVYVKVSPRYPDQTGETGGYKSVVKAVLQYKILPSGSWRTVRTIQNVTWAMNFTSPVALFGKNCIDIPDIAAGTSILIRLYLTDGTYETGSLATDITSTVPASASSSSGGTYEGGWTAPFVFRVVYSGKRRAK